MFELTPTQLATAITAIGALGTAAFGLVDTTKAIRGGVSNAGFGCIEELLILLAPDEAGIPGGSAITQTAISETLKANWMNGTPASDQKGIAKSLIKLRLNSETAAALAKATGVKKEFLATVAQKLESGTALDQSEMNVYGKFDLLLSTMIDRAYQRADQQYRNVSKALACAVAVLLAEVAAGALTGWTFQKDGADLRFYALIVGLLATPLAPIAKDLATGLTTAAQAVQSTRGKS